MHLEAVEGGDALRKQLREQWSDVSKVGVGRGAVDVSLAAVELIAGLREAVVQAARLRLGRLREFRQRLVGLDLVKDRKDGVDRDERVGEGGPRRSA